MTMPRYAAVLLVLTACAGIDAAIDPARDLMVRWSTPDARAVKLLRDAGFSAVFIP